MTKSKKRGAKNKRRNSGEPSSAKRSSGSARGDRAAKRRSVATESKDQRRSKLTCFYYFSMISVMFIDMFFLIY